MMRLLTVLCLLQIISLGPLIAHSHSGNVNVGEQPLSKIAIHRATYALHENASAKAYSLDTGTNALGTNLLGTKVMYVTFLCSKLFCESWKRK